MSRRKRSQSLSIRRTANISTSMRKEIESQGEVFEPTRTGSATESSEPMSFRVKLTASTINNTSSGSSGPEHSPSRAKRMAQTNIKHMKEEIFPFDNDLLSFYEKSSNTVSLVSIDEFDDAEAEDFEKKCQSSAMVPEMLIPAERVQNAISDGVKAEVISDFDLCLAMDPSRQHPQLVSIDTLKRFDAEQMFCKSIVSDIEKVILLTWRNDIEIKVIKTRDNNHMPKCRIQLMRRIDAPKMSQQIYEHKELYGFEPVEKQEASENSEIGKSQFSVLETPMKTMTSTFSIIRSLFGFGSSPKK